VPGVVGSFPIPLARFQHQVRQAQAHGWGLGRVSALREPVAAHTLYITGDDGTVDWVRNVLPWCEKVGIPTHTALISGPWLDEPVYPVAHRLQVLLSLPGRELPLPSLTAAERAYIDRVYAYETDPRRRYLKGACNVVFDDARSRALLGPPDTQETQLLAARFARPQEYRGYRLAEFGAHTVSHQAFGGDPGAYVHDEVLPCMDALHEHRLTATKYFTLPMRPRYPATVEQLVPALQAQGFEGVLDQAGEWDRASFVIPRIDAKNVESFLGLEAWSEHVRDEPERLARHEVPR
jgi:hypothetical protein